MTTEEKKAYFLLKAAIFNYHGLNNDEKADLEDSASRLNGREELKWANDFISEDYYNFFTRARQYLYEVIKNYPMEKRINYINTVWQANSLKGFVTELEASAMIRFAEDWGVKDHLMTLVLQHTRNKR